MKRRQFLVSLLGGGVGLSLASCGGEAKSGPVEIKWDRDTDARCSMVIGDQRFAAQIRDPNRKVWKFDDIGCAVFWLAHQQFSEASANTEYWVNDYLHPGLWLDARRAYYLDGKKSPMGYQFGALAEPEAGTIDYAVMKKRVLARGK
jgi:hypothetical protein